MSICLIFVHSTTSDGRDLAALKKVVEAHLGQEILPGCYGVDLGDSDAHDLHVEIEKAVTSGPYIVIRLDEHNFKADAERDSACYRRLGLDAERWVMERLAKTTKSSGDVKEVVDKVVDEAKKPST
jgi:hypothetical protein